MTYLWEGRHHILFVFVTSTAWHSTWYTEVLNSCLLTTSRAGITLRKGQKSESFLMKESLELPHTLSML